MKKILLSLLLTIVFALPAFSEMTDMSMKGHGQMIEKGYMDKMGDTMGMCLGHSDTIGLTDEQLMKMRPLHLEMLKEHARFSADLKIAEIELMEIMDVKDFDLDKASAAVKKVGEVKTAHHLKMLQAMKEMRTILTDEQFKKMKMMMAMKPDRKAPVKMKTKMRK
ncbi:MAG: Spy/CpxP family protein refolding chaperone [Desulfuromonadaceae bacterium]